MLRHGLFALCLLPLLLSGCTGIPEAVRPVTDFQLEYGPRKRG